MLIYYINDMGLTLQPGMSRLATRKFQRIDVKDEYIRSVISYRKQTIIYVTQILLFFL